MSPVKNLVPPEWISQINHKNIQSRTLAIVGGRIRTLNLQNPYALYLAPLTNKSNLNKC